MSVTGGYFQAGKPGSGKEKRTLQSVKTHFFVGTEVGHCVNYNLADKKYFSYLFQKIGKCNNYPKLLQTLSLACFSLVSPMHPHPTFFSYPTHHHWQGLQNRWHLILFPENRHVTIIPNYHIIYHSPYISLVSPMHPPTPTHHHHLGLQNRLTAWLW